MHEEISDNKVRELETSLFSERCATARRNIAAQENFADYAKKTNATILNLQREIVGHSNHIVSLKAEIDWRDQKMYAVEEFLLSIAELGDDKKQKKLNKWLINQCNFFQKAQVGDLLVCSINSHTVSRLNSTSWCTG